MCSFSCRAAVSCSRVCWCLMANWWLWLVSAWSIHDSALCVCMLLSSAPQLQHRLLWTYCAKCLCTAATCASLLQVYYVHQSLVLAAFTVALCTCSLHRMSVHGCHAAGRQACLCCSCISYIQLLVGNETQHGMQVNLGWLALQMTSH